MSNCEFKFIVHTEYEKDYSVQNHTHPCYELVYYLDGTGESVINSTNYKFGQDTFILVGPKTPHSEASTTGSEVIFMGFTTNYEDLREGIYENGSEAIKAALKEIEAERNGKRPYHKAMLNLLAEKIVLLLLRTSSGKTGEQSVPDVLEYIRMNANKNVSIRDMASELGYSYDYFRKMVASAAGENAKDFLLGIKIKNAKEYLLNTSMSVNAISIVTGFSSPSHLCSVFREREGLTPNDFRETHRNDTFINNLSKNVR